MKKNLSKKKITLLVRFDKGIEENEINSINEGMKIFCKIFKKVNYKLYFSTNEKAIKCFF